jgi:dihydrofolate reductase
VGHKTYESAKSVIKLTPKTLRIVLTNKPKKFTNEVVVGQLEFSSERVEELVARLSQKRYREVLVVGGGEVKAVFLKAGLINDIFLTIEPLLFGQGRGVFYNPGFQELELMSFCQ